MPLHSYRYIYARFRRWLTVITFIGVVVHEAAHNVTCRWFSVPVYETCYFRFGNPSGYVKHAYPEKFQQSFMISLAPFFFNTAVSVLSYYGGISLITILDQGVLVWPPSITTSAAILLPWLAFSAAVHSIPSNQDATQIWDHVKRAFPWNPIALLTSPVVLFVKILNLLRYFGIDIVYALALGIVGFSLSKRYPILEVISQLTAAIPDEIPVEIISLGYSLFI